MTAINSAPVRIPTISEGLESVLLHCILTGNQHKGGSVVDSGGVWQSRNYPYEGGLEFARSPGWFC